jgi:hypothetical protein
MVREGGTGTVELLDVCGRYKLTVYIKSPRENVK